FPVSENLAQFGRAQPVVMDPDGVHDAAFEFTQCSHSSKSSSFHVVRFPQVYLYILSNSRTAGRWPPVSRAGALPAVGRDRGCRRLGRRNLVGTVSGVAAGAWSGALAVGERKGAPLVQEVLDGGTIAVELLRSVEFYVT